MGDWKEEAIYKYCTLTTTIATYEESIQDDTRIRALVEEEDKILKEINKITESRYHAIEEAKRDRDVVTMKLKEEWDIEGKSFKCDVGSATIRTTKSLVITDNWALIERLAKLLNDIGKACDLIRTFDLSAIRKYMDVDLIDGAIAHYDEKRNVVISTPKKESNRDEE